MMKISPVFLLVVPVALFLLAVPVKAESQAGNSAYLTAPTVAEIKPSSIYPASFLYFLKPIREKMELVLAFSNQAKAEDYLNFGERRLREVKALILNNRQDLIEVTLENYRHQVDLAQKVEVENPNLAIQTGQALGWQANILAGLYGEISDPNGKRAIRASIIKLEELNKKPASQDQEILQRQLAACQFLEQASEDSSINEPERAILKQKADSCQPSQ